MTTLRFGFRSSVRKKESNEIWVVIWVWFLTKSSNTAIKLKELEVSWSIFWHSVAIRGHCKGWSLKKADHFVSRIWLHFVSNTFCYRVKYSTENWENFSPVKLQTVLFCSEGYADFSPRWLYLQPATSTRDRLSAHTHGFLQQQT